MCISTAFSRLPASHIFLDKLAHKVSLESCLEADYGLHSFEALTVRTVYFGVPLHRVTDDDLNVQVAQWRHWSNAQPPICVHVCTRS